MQLCREVVSMKKNIGILAGIFCLAAILAACGRSADETGNFNTPGNGSSGSLETILALESETVEATETGEPETVLIYYGSSIGKELKTEEVDLPRKTPEAIIGALRTKNIVSVDTKVNDFSISEDGKHITLDLSAGFRDYLKTMQEGSEAVIMAALTNSFLDAYDARDLLVTINGECLETKNRTYKDKLGFVDFVE